MNWSQVLDQARQGNPAPPRRVDKTEDEWRAQLGEDEFHVMRNKGTERPGSSEMCSLFTPGIYACGGCDTTLFDSTSKFESGTGWPSFTAPLADDVVAFHADGGHGLQRIEVTCNVCDAHLGHVFPDGPAPSGLRFCINALALTKVGKE